MATKVKKLDFYKKSEDIFEKYKDENMAIFLDSSLENAMGQYSVIGLNPYLILKECDGIFYENDVPQEITFEEGMQKYLEKEFEGWEITNKDKINQLYGEANMVSLILKGKRLVLPSNLYRFPAVIPKSFLFPMPYLFSMTF